MASVNVGVRVQKGVAGLIEGPCAVQEKPWWRLVGPGGAGRPWSCNSEEELKGAKSGARHPASWLWHGRF